MKAMRSMPLAAKACSAQSRRRRPPTSAKHFGVSAVVGISRRPRPAPMMIACIIPSRPHFLLSAGFRLGGGVPEQRGGKGGGQGPAGPDADGDLPAVTLQDP